MHAPTPHRLKWRSRLNVCLTAPNRPHGTSSTEWSDNGMIDHYDPEEVCVKASAALASSPIRDLRGLIVRNDHGALQVTGHVKSYYHKQVALETVRSVACGLRIQNTVAVD